MTQEERLDLTDKQVKAENLAYTIEIFKSLEAITKGKKVVMEKEVKDCILKANCDLMAENERLKKQLNDYEKALKDYADGDFYEAFVNFKHNKFDSLDIIDKKGNIIYTKAQETLEKWEVK